MPNPLAAEGRQTLHHALNAKLDVPEKCSSLKQTIKWMKAEGQIEEITKLVLHPSGTTQKIPKQIGALTKLRVLRVRPPYGARNQPNEAGVVEVSGKIKKCVALVKLRLEGNNICRLPKGVGKLERLRELRVEHNRLETLPETIGGCVRMRELRATGNQLTSLPDGIGGLKMLERLRLEYNQLERLPKTFGELQALRKVNFDHNRLTEISPELCRLKELRTLSLNFNQLQAVPEEIEQMQGLEKLLLSSNQIREVPAAICQLQNLRKIGLAFNELKTLPKGFDQLKNLEEVVIMGNELDMPALMQLWNLHQAGVKVYADVPLIDEFSPGHPNYCPDEIEEREHSCKGTRAWKAGRKH